CHGKGNWLSRLVFLGVLVDDDSWNKVQDIKTFKDSRDWGVVKATLENMEGRNFVGGGYYPYIKIGELVEVNEAYEYFKKRSIVFTAEEMNKVRNGCHILYERLWQEVGEERPEDRSARTPKEYEEREKIRRELRIKELPAGFAERFASFTRKYFDEL